MQFHGRYSCSATVDGPFSDEIGKAYTALRLTYSSGHALNHNEPHLQMARIGSEQRNAEEGLDHGDRPFLKKMGREEAMREEQQGFPTHASYPEGRGGYTLLLKFFLVFASHM